MKHDEISNQNIYYYDTLVNNESEHRYRLRGRSYFGVDGPYGEELVGMGTPGPIPHSPVVNNLIQVGEEAIRIEWQFAQEAEQLIRGFKIYRSNLSSQLGDLITPSLIDVSQRSYVDDDPKASSFYTVVLIDENDHEIHSLPRLISLADNQPPGPPVDLAGTMDSLGLVTLRWAPNTEPDHQGYRVYISNQEDGHFIQLTSDAIADTIYEHHVTMETTSEEVYFKLKAIDYFGNYSSFSEVVAVKRPDLIPPTPPRIIKVEGRETGVFLEWSPSPSRDIVGIELQRRPSDDTLQTWLSFYEARGGNVNVGGSELDYNTQLGRTYQYRIRVEDDAGMSAVSGIATGTRIDNGKRGEIINLQARRLESGTVTLTFDCNYQVQPILYLHIGPIIDKSLSQIV
ncbi:MAG: fibronectin type III domain-containing protein [Bacteroidota bacterium]